MEQGRAHRAMFSRGGGAPCSVSNVAQRAERAPGVRIIAAIAPRGVLRRGAPVARRGGTWHSYLGTVVVLCSFDLDI